MKLTWGASLSAAALLLLLLGTLSRSWWNADQGGKTIGLGLLSAERCMPAWNPDGDGPLECEVLRYTELPRSDAEKNEWQTWIQVGRGGFGAGLVTSLALALTALLGFARRSLPGPVSPGRIAAALSGAAFAVAIVFVVLLPDEAREADASLGYSMVVYVLGAILGVAGGGLAHSGRGEARPEPPPMGLPVPGVRQPPSPACPQCHAPTVYVAEHARHFCSRCRLYV